MAKKHRGFGGKLKGHRFKLPYDFLAGSLAASLGATANIKLTSF